MFLDLAPVTDSNTNSLSIPTSFRNNARQSFRTLTYSNNGKIIRLVGTIEPSTLQRKTLRLPALCRHQLSSGFHCQASPGLATHHAQNAFEQILSSGLPSLYRGAYRLLGNTPDAEDAVQLSLPLQIVGRSRNVQSPILSCPKR